MGGKQAGVKRWLKEVVYARLPGGFRAFAYFFYRYVLRLGFLDGRAGTAFHFLQGYWYRYLVDAKVSEVEQYMVDSGCKVQEAIELVLGVRVDLVQMSASRVEGTCNRGAGSPVAGQPGPTLALPGNGARVGAGVKNAVGVATGAAQSSPHPQ